MSAFDLAIRTARTTYAETVIATKQYVVCVCGALFYAPAPYADHVEQCEIDQRKAGAAGVGVRTPDA